ncbi:LytR/AlgR family response regulator transcription factor [Thalassotalea ganghwensis]
MNVLIVEDEVMVAKRLQRLTKAILGEKLHHIKHINNLDDAESYIDEHPIDVLLLDLNLNAQDGFTLLQQAVAESFQTIIVSANIDKAITAFEYGVIDFVAKPFNQSRLSKAFARLAEHTSASTTKFLSIKKQQRVEVISLQDIEYIQGAGNYSELVMLDGSIHLHEKNLDKLSQLLPSNFVRIHKSYIANLSHYRHLQNYPGSKYELALLSMTPLPVSRTKVKALRAKIDQL